MASRGTRSSCSLRSIGTISGWNGNGTEAVIAATNPGAVYTGLTITTDRPGGSNLLFAADNANNKVDVYDGKFHLMQPSFTDSTIPAGFAAYGIQDINNHVYVTYASTGSAPGGFIDIFDEDGFFDRRLASGVPLDQPWGLALAPSNFGPAS